MRLSEGDNADIKDSPYRIKGGYYKKRNKKTTTTTTTNKETNKQTNQKQRTNKQTKNLHAKSNSQYGRPHPSSKSPKQIRKTSNPVKSHARAHIWSLLGCVLAQRPATCKERLTYTSVKHIYVPPHWDKAAVQIGSPAPPTSHSERESGQTTLP